MSGLTSGISLGVVSKRTPLVDNSAPSGAVASLVATTNGPDSIALTWTAKAGARRYRVERSLNGSTGWALVAYPTTNSYTDTGLNPATQYFFRVRAQNAAGAAAYSSTANATTSSSALIDFVGGWALTAGPQQTLALSGAVASGALDLTEVQNTGSVGPTYNADGARFPLDADSGTRGKLTQTAASLGPLPDQPYLISALVSHVAHDINSTQNLVGRSSNADDDEFVISTNGLVDGDHEAIYFTLKSQSSPSRDGPSTYPTQPFFLGADPHIIFALYDPAGAFGPTLSIQVDTSDPVTSDPEGPLVSFLSDVFVIGGGIYPYNPYEGAVKYVRVWSGPNAKALPADPAFCAWYANSGAGRTDAELAAYTP